MADLNNSETASAGGNQVVHPVEPKADPEWSIKPQLVYLGHFLGMDVYMDVQPVNGSLKHADIARRIFKTMMEEHN